MARIGATLAERTSGEKTFDIRYWRTILNKRLPSSHLSSIFVISLVLSLGISLAACGVAPQTAPTPTAAPPTPAATATPPPAATNTPQSEAVETPQNSQQSTASAPAPTKETDREKTDTKESF